MLIKMTVRNFKIFEEVNIDLGDPVIFIGPNNSGKTSALQALTLWEIGLNRWNEKRKGGQTPEKRPGVTINRRDLVSVPVPHSNLLWRNCHTRDTKIIKSKQRTDNVRIDIIVEGITTSKSWKCGLEFDYANEESFYCRPLRLSEDKKTERMEIPPEAEKVKIALLPPMSGLVANEVRLDEGAINVRVGEGRTAEVLRNLCYNVYSNYPNEWKKLNERISRLFGAQLRNPLYIKERGEINLKYKEKSITFDLSSTGRGLQQTLILLSYMYANRGSVLLLDEPDAHLEILRQRQIYQILTEVANETDSQIIAASHSEIILNEAAGRDVVVAFVGKPHRINDQGSQVLKSLKDIGFEDYYLAEQTGWVLYLEGSTDLAILRAFATKLKHNRAIEALDKPFVHYIANQVSAVKTHFFGLKEAYSKLLGVALFDRIENVSPEELGLKLLIWSKREIENYICFKETLVEYSKQSGLDQFADTMFETTEVDRRVSAMNDAIDEVEQALKALDKPSPWSDDIKVSDDFLKPLFKKYFEKLGLYNIMAKKNYHELVPFMPDDKIDKEIVNKLDAIAEIHENTSPFC